MKSLTIKESRTQVQWRDVKDVLPPVGVPVVVYLDDGHFDVGTEPYVADIPECAAIANLKADGFDTDSKVVAEYNRLNADDDHAEGCQCAICRC